MPRKHSKGGGKGGGGYGGVMGGGRLNNPFPAVGQTEGTPLSIPALALEVAGIVGGIRVQLGDVHVHMEGPLCPRGVRGLREECEDGPARMGQPCMAIVVRRYTPGTKAECTPSGEQVTLPVPDALGCHMYIRHYIVAEGGLAFRMPVAEVMRAHNFNFSTGEPLEEEPGLGYE
jgi:hypothetical protein